MDAKRRKEEAKARVKVEADLKEIQQLMKESIKYYHKEWNIVRDRQSRAAELIEDMPKNLARAGMTSLKLANMSAAAKRSFAREVMGVTADHELAFVLEPRLPEVVLFDFLARDGAAMELTFRIAAEREKMQKRFDGDEVAEYADRCIDNGERAQEVGQKKDADKFFKSAQESINKARQLYALVSVSNDEAEKQWEVTCNEPDKYPMLTREKKADLQKALNEREKGEIWKDRNWVVRSAMDNPVRYCLGTVKVGVSYAAINQTEKWEHSPEGLHPDGYDTQHIMTRLEKRLAQALIDQKADVEFKALALCVIDEVKQAQLEAVAAARRDREGGEAKAIDAIQRVDELPPPDKQDWEDLDADALGEMAVTDEVHELHEAARVGNMRRLRWLIEECEEQHYWAVNLRYKPYKAVKNEPVWVDGLDHQARSALFMAARFNIERAGDYLLQEGADINRRDLNKVSPLHTACANGASEMVGLLLKRGADVEIRDLDEQTPLHYCCRYALGNMDVVRSLVAAGANINAQDKLGQTPIHQIIKNRRFGEKELYFLNFLLLMGGDADARDGNAATPLDLCDDMDARKIIKDAYSIQGDLRVDRWGPSGVPPPADGVARPVPIEEQALVITGGVPLLAVLHKGKRAYVNRDACRACGIGIVVTVPYMDTPDFAHMCVCCAAKEVNSSSVRSFRSV
mmetsp:Transcript_24444/g.58608  ORF Transcript_24444/g.58608 Transcript_24444/m.58608 type:complete len:686 (-) Transcript_24444:52-2109(-)